MRRSIGVLSALALVWSLIAVPTVAAADQGSQFKVLVFTRAVAGKHASTSAGVSAIKALGKQLGMKVVAVGVETRQDWEMLRQTQCDQAQGYFFGKPVAGATIRGWGG